MFDPHTQVLLYFSTVADRRRRHSVGSIRHSSARCDKSVKTNRRELAIAAGSPRATLTDSIHLGGFFFSFFFFKKQKSEPVQILRFGEMNLSSGRSRKSCWLSFTKPPVGGGGGSKWGLGSSVELSIVSLSEKEVGSSPLLSKPVKKKQSGGISTDAASQPANTTTKTAKKKKRQFNS